MKTKITGRNIKVTDALESVIDKKLSKFDRYFKPEVTAQVGLSSIKDTKSIEITIPFDGTHIRAEERTEDMYKSIDLVIEKIERQIRKHKTKMQRKLKESSIVYDLIPQEEVEEGEDEVKIVKNKRFTLKPMDAEEAVLQMELVGHNFFVYQDADTNEINVVYKRKDGNYGLIEPQI